ncbi:glycoside hydrolase family 13 protein [Marinilactibacillus sp. Marseille-P9653]|uniref:glycoside hydrolase family 13 protein n=1 Tax=Marinilactibacillus sp. Marseille-P9653 TaxID=2866583 RepID=UPI002106E411|nr:glycoside hydrolase family 13 protein [Marinilactibacillus sp. Marseille-P9653]
MNKQAIYHKANSSYAYMKDVQTMCLTIRTARDIECVYLLTDHPDGWVKGSEGYYWKKEKTKMQLLFQTTLYDYWQIEHRPYNHQMRYGFILETHEERALYIERGWFSPDDVFIGNDINSYFAFPYLHESEVFQAPKWVKEIVWYQVMPDRFYNPENISWGSKEQLGQYDFHNGTLEGIRKKLPYLKNLGISGIYLTPIFQSPTAHRYDTENYFEIDPRLGSKEIFKSLVDDAHTLGIRILLDGVFNHIGDQSVYFQDVLKNGEQSAYKDWFYIEQFPLESAEGIRLDTHYRHFTPNMPKLNTLNKEVQKYLIDVALYWVETFGIDGWRLDVVNEIDHAFLRLLRSRLKSAYPDCYIVGEIWHNADSWLLGDQLDGVMNYPLGKPILEWAAAGRISTADFQEQFVQALLQYSENIQQGMLTLLDSHDAPRLYEYTGFDRNKTELCLTMLFLLPGSICLYYGTEMGMSGYEDPENRKPMQWTKSQAVDFKEHIQLLSRLRRSDQELLARNRFTFLEVQNDVLVLKKETETHALYLLINKSSEQKWIELSELKDKKVENLLAQHSVIVDSLVPLKPESHVLYKFEKISS